MKKIRILLDFDGVMVSGSSWKLIDNELDGFYKFNDLAIKKFNEIASRYDEVDVIITSSHRNRFTNLEWGVMLSNRGLDFTSITVANKQFILGESRLTLVNDIMNVEYDGETLILDDDKSLLNLEYDRLCKLMLTDTHIGLV